MSIKLPCINPYSAGIFFVSTNLKSSEMASLALSASFEYLCYWSMVIIICLIPSAWGLSLDVKI